MARWMATSWLLSERSSLRNASRIPLLDIVRCSLQGRAAAASRRPPKCTNVRGRRRDRGAVTDPTRRIRRLQRRPARDSRPPHASRPRSMPASRRGRAIPVRPRVGPARQRPSPSRLDGWEHLVVSHAGVRLVSPASAARSCRVSRALESGRDPARYPSAGIAARADRSYGGNSPRPGEVTAASHSLRSTGIGRSPVFSGGTKAGRSATLANPVRQETPGSSVEPLVSPRSRSRRR